MKRARRRSARSGRTEHVFAETRYAAGSWKHQRRVVIKAEVVRLAGREPRDNPRFVVTNLDRPPRSLYEKVYCARGDIENRIKELLDGLQIDRTSCSRFAANQVPRPADGCRLRAHAGASPVRRPHRVRSHPGDVAPRPTPQARRSCRPLRPPRRPPSAARHTLPRRVAPHRARPRSQRRIGPTRATPPLPSRAPYRHGRAVDTCRSSTSRSPLRRPPHAPHATQRTGNGRRELAFVPPQPGARHPSNPFGVESRPSGIIRVSRSVPRSPVSCPQKASAPRAAKGRTAPSLSPTGQA